MCIGFFEKATTGRVESREQQEKLGYTEVIKHIYSQLLQFGYRYSELDNMTLKELTQTLKNIKLGEAEKYYRQALGVYIAVGSVLNGSQFPKTSEDLYPELYPPKPTIKKPLTLQGKIGGKRYG